MKYVQPEKNPFALVSFTSFQINRKQIVFLPPKALKSRNCWMSDAIILSHLEQESTPAVPQAQKPVQPVQPIPDGAATDVPKPGLNGAKVAGLPEPPQPAAVQWQRSSDMTPEAWQQQVDQQQQQQQQQDSQQQAEPWANRNPPRQGPHNTDPIFKESKSMYCSGFQCSLFHYKQGLFTICMVCSISGNRIHPLWSTGPGFSWLHVAWSPNPYWQAYIIH